MLLLVQKNTWLRLILSLVVCCLAASSQALGAPISGRVCNKANQPLPGVAITLQNTSVMVITNGAGEFFLNSNEASPVLTFKYAGYQTQTLRIVAKNLVTITLFKIGTPILPQAEGIEMVVLDGLVAVDEEPAFPGGPEAYQAYIKRNLHYPETAEAKGISGMVMVGFTVDEQGRILNAQVVKSCEGLNEEALRLVNLMPWWVPARLDGKPVRATSSLRIRFELQRADR